MKKFTYRDVVTGKKVHSDVPLKDPALVLISERKNMQMQGAKIHQT